MLEGYPHVNLLIAIHTLLRNESLQCEVTVVLEDPLMVFFRTFCWNYSFADRKPCPAEQRGNYGQSKLGVQQTLYGRQSRLTDGKQAYGRWQWKSR